MKSSFSKTKPEQVSLRLSEATTGPSNYLLTRTKASIGRTPISVLSIPAGTSTEEQRRGNSVQPDDYGYAEQAYRLSFDEIVKFRRKKLEWSHSSEMGRSLTVRSRVPTWTSSWRYGGVCQEKESQNKIFFGSEESQD
jgi:hypothetical protein